MELRFPAYPSPDQVGYEVPLHDLRDEDAITCTQMPGSPGRVRLTLVAGPDATGWKGLEVKAPDDGVGPGRVARTLETWDECRGPARAVVAPATDPDFDRLHVRLLKAMPYGVHAAVYDLPPLHTRRGYDLVFRWERDRAAVTPAGAPPLPRSAT